VSVGFGVDAYAWDTLVTGRLARGSELVAQAIFRRLTTARGTLIDGADGEVYGLDLNDFVGQVGPQNAIATLPDVIRAEVLKDDRVDSVDVSVVSVTQPDASYYLTIEIAATLADEAGDFTLTISVDEVSTAFLGLST